MHVAQLPAGQDSVGRLLQGSTPKLLIKSLYPFCWHGLTHDAFILGYLYVLIIFVFREKKQMLFVTLDLVTE